MQSAYSIWKSGPVGLALSGKGGSRLGAVLASTAVQDGIFAALIVGFRVPASIGAPGAAACLLLTGLYAALRIPQLGDVFRQCWVQLAFPALALLSVLWADYATVTLRAAVQMSLTALAGLILSQSRHPRAVLVGLFVTYAGYTFGSLAVGHTRPIGLTHEIALLGLGGEDKNYFADTAGTGLLLSLAMLALCIERRLAGCAVIAAGAVAACAAATFRANSAGSLAATAVAAGLLVGLLLLRCRPPVLKLIVGAGLILLLLVGCFFFDQLLAVIQQMSNKDAGLTGRAYLWYRADFVIAQSPWLGHGYFGFWTPANPDAVGLWHYFDVRQEGTGFNFHNGYIQTLVELGYAGLIVLLATWLVGLVMLLRRFVLTQSLATCFWVGYLALEFAKTPVEAIRPGTLTAPTILMYLALGFSCFPVGGLGSSRVKRQVS